MLVLTNTLTKNVVEVYLVMMNKLVFDLLIGANQSPPPFELSSSGS